RVRAPHRQSADAVTDLQPRATRAELFDDTDQLIARRERRLRSARKIGPGAQLGVGERHSRRQHLDQYLARSRPGILLLDDFQDLGSSEMVDNDALHRPPPLRRHSICIAPNAPSRPSLRLGPFGPSRSSPVASIGTLRTVSGAVVNIRVFLLDDHEVVRRGVRELLEAEDDMTVVGEAGTAEEALGRIPPTKPHVALLDVRLPDGNGVEVCREIRSAHPEVACIMLTSFSDDEALMQAVVAGASGYLLKQIRGVDIVDSVRRVARGES